MALDCNQHLLKSVISFNTSSATDKQHRQFSVRTSQNSMGAAQQEQSAAEHEGNTAQGSTGSTGQHRAAPGSTGQHSMSTAHLLHLELVHMKSLACSAHFQHEADQGVICVAVWRGSAPVQHLVEQAHAALGQASSHLGCAGLSCCLEQGGQYVVEGKGVWNNGHLQASLKALQ